MHQSRTRNPQKPASQPALLKKTFVHSDIYNYSTRQNKVEQGRTVDQRCVKGILPTIFRYIESDKLIFSKAVLPKKYFWLKDLQEYLSVVHSKIDIDDFWLITTTIAHIPKTVRNCFTYGYLIPIFKGRPLRARLWMCVICKFDMQFYIEWF